jgi:hypothetical protein
MTTTEPQPRYSGTEEADTTSIERYLRENYTENGEPISRERCSELLREHDSDEIDKGIRIFRSHASYLGDKVAEAAGLTEIPSDDETLWDYDVEEEDDE